MGEGWLSGCTWTWWCGACELAVWKHTDVVWCVGRECTNVGMGVPIAVVGWACEAGHVLLCGSSTIGEHEYKSTGCLELSGLEGGWLGCVCGVRAAVCCRNEGQGEEGVGAAWRIHHHDG